MSTSSAFKFITIDEVVKASLKDRPILNFQAEAARIAHFYGNQILTEDGQWLPTEDAEVLSIETVK